MTDLQEYMNFLWTATKVVGHGTITERRVMYGNDIQVIVDNGHGQTDYLSGRDLFNASVELK